MYAHIYAYIFETYAYLNIHICMYMHKNTSTNTNIHTKAYTNAYSYTYTYETPRMHVQIQMHVHAYICTLRTCRNTHAFKNIYMCINVVGWNLPGHGPYSKKSHTNITLELYTYITYAWTCIDNSCQRECNINIKIVYRLAKNSRCP